MKRTFILAHDLARQRAVEAVKSAPQGFAVTVAEPTRNSEQNALLHAILSDVAAQCEWAGRRWSVEEWKRLMTSAWCRTRNEGAQMIPAIDGQGFDVLYQRTSTLSKRECSDLCEYIFAWATEHGVEWTGPVRRTA
jgi:hypothetical protein